MSDRRPLVSEVVLLVPTDADRWNVWRVIAERGRGVIEITSCKHGHHTRDRADRCLSRRGAPLNLV